MNAIGRLDQLSTNNNNNQESMVINGVLIKPTKTAPPLLTCKLRQQLGLTNRCNHSLFHCIFIRATLADVTSNRLQQVHKLVRLYNSTTNVSSSHLSYPALLINCYKPHAGTIAKIIRLMQSQILCTINHQVFE